MIYCVNETPLATKDIVQLIDLANELGFYEMEDGKERVQTTPNKLVFGFNDLINLMIFLINPFEIIELLTNYKTLHRLILFG